MEGKALRERELIALGGLIHDIGKFLQRAKGEGFKFGNVNLDNLTEAWDKTYGKEHAYLSKVLLEFLKEEDIIDDNLLERLEDCGVRHHNPNNSLESVISQVADWYSASEREYTLGSCIGLLHSVFERVSLKPKEKRKHDWIIEHELSETRSHGNMCSEVIINVETRKTETKTSGFYKLKPLSMVDPKAIFPETFESGYVKLKDKQKEHLLIVPTSVGKYEGLKSHERGYKELFEVFINEVKLAKYLNGSAFLNFFYYLLYKYTWCVPASTYDTERGSRHYPDISLFDHSRVLAAVAVSLYDWAKARGKPPDELKPMGRELPTDKEDCFLLVAGDIGGIQTFIYNIHKATSESELSIAKALRGRSFFLTILPEVITRYILMELDYPITNMLFVGGGKFFLLIGNTEHNVRKLKEIERKMNEWMYEEFQGELALTMAHVSMKGKALRERQTQDNTNEPQTYLDHVEWLELELDRKKKQKLGEFIFKDFKIDPHKADEICPSCRSLPKRKDENLCKWCNNSQKWGEVLPKVRYIAFDWGSESEVEIKNDKKIIDLGEFGRTYLLESEDLKGIKQLPEILDIEDTNIGKIGNVVVNGFKFIGHATPKAPEDEELLKKLQDIWKSKTERREEGDTKLKPGDILPFDVLVEFAKGDKKLGFFRADVDFLGLIFSDGLRFDELGNEEIYTISRVANLSRMLDLFFTGLLNRFAEEISKEYVKKRIEIMQKSESDEEKLALFKLLLDSKGNLKVGSLIYIVYSGGDDLFIIAPYDLAIDFAIKLREYFREFTCENSDFGISGGIFIGRHNTPIHLVAKFAESLESKAKDARDEKDMIAIFDKTLRWEKIEEDKGVSWCKNNGKNKEKDFVALKDVLELSDRLTELISQDKLSRAFVYKLLKLYEHYCKKGKVKKDEVNLMIYPRIYYHIGRNIKDEDLKAEMVRAFLKGIDEKYEDPSSVMKILNVITSLALMKTRKGGE